MAHTRLKQIAAHTALSTIAVCALISCGGGNGNKSSPTSPAASASPVVAATNVPDTIMLRSIFAEGGLIPGEYTCDGLDASPPLQWSGAPAATQAFVLFVEDPDAGGTFSQWVLYNLPAATTALPSGIPANPSFDDGSKQGLNSRGSIGYTGPCPPRGARHRYQFFIFALDTPLFLDAGLQKRDVVPAMQSHILARGQLSAVYSR